MAQSYRQREKLIYQLNRSQQLMWAGPPRLWDCCYMIRDISFLACPTSASGRQAKKCAWWYFQASLICQSRLPNASILVLSPGLVTRKTSDIRGQKMCCVTDYTATGRGTPYQDEHQPARRHFLLSGLKRPRPRILRNGK